MNKKLNPEIQLEKIAIRKNMRELRENLSFDKREDYAQALCQHIKHWQPFLDAKYLAFYVAMRGEMDPHRILEEALTQGKNCYLPLLSEHNSLEFREYHRDDRLIPNIFGIPEPQSENTMPKAPEEFDLVFVPLVAFDIKGNRVGMGGGYYDRTFQTCQARTKHPRLIGLAYEFQKVTSCPTAEWDIALDAIVTEKKIYARQKHEKL